MLFKIFLYMTWEIFGTDEKSYDIMLIIETHIYYVNMKINGYSRKNHQNLKKSEILKISIFKTLWGKCSFQLAKWHRICYLHRHTTEMDKNIALFETWGNYLLIFQYFSVIFSWGRGNIFAIYTIFLQYLIDFLYWIES